MFSNISFGQNRQSKQDFPRLGGMLIGNHAYEQPAYQNDIAKLDMVVFGFVPNFDEWTKTTIADVLRNIKSRNSDFIALEYVIINEQYLNAPAWPGVGRKITSERWWLYENGASGQIVRGAGRNTQGEVNYTRFGPRDASGLSYSEWFLNWIGDKYVSNHDQWDGLYIDNFWRKPRHAGDWNRDGLTDSSDRQEVIRWHRQGMIDFADAARRKFPGMLVTGNIGDWSLEFSPISEYKNVVDGGFLEHYIGKNWSPEGIASDGSNNGWGSWERMMEEYRLVASQVKQRSLMMFNQLGNPSDYQSFRYGFGSCLLDDAHYSYSSDKANYATVEWFDEYDLNGTSTTDWLGAAIDPPQTSAWKDGIYRRRFENGMVLVNPRGNGERNIAIEPGYSHFKGTQAPNVNNGLSTTSVNLGDRDAVLLVRSGTLPEISSEPESPTLIVN